MKKLKSDFRLLLVAAFVLILSIGLTSCDENPEIVAQQGYLPESFGVDIPSSISNPTTLGGGRIGRTEEELSGDAIYRHLRLFIFIGEASKEITEEIISAIKTFNIESLQVLTYESEDDGRNKTLTVTQNVEFEGTTWEYMLTVIDADSENEADGGMAMQVFWNNEPSLNGISILKPYNINRNDTENGFNAIYRIDYDASGDDVYDATMEVSIAGLAFDRPDADEFSMKNLRMFVGKKGDFIDVYGNSNHPRARLLDEANVGFNWAFVASGNDALNLAVAEVGLPPSNLDADSRAMLLEDYSVRNVFTTRIKSVFPNIPQNLLDAYLVNTNPPGFFDRDGFIRSELSPGADWNPMAERIKNLAPYNPLETTTLEINFK
ncbi:MAG: hypothetical protein RLO12_11200 [Fulvivirga sp.]